MNSIANKNTDDAAFKRAATHSKRVIFFKRILPILAIGGLLAGGTAIFALSKVSNVSVSLPDSTISDGKLVMANPKLNGFTNTRKPYRVTANRAIQDLNGQSAIELEVLRADVELEDGKTAVLTSPTGSFDSVTSILILPQRALLTMSDGLEAIMGRADIDIQSGKVSASNNIKISNEEMKITAEAMQILDGGKQIVFEKSVRLILTPNTKEVAATEPTAN